jgi:hypothetical protein
MATVRWDVPPTRIGDEIVRRAQRVAPAVAAVGQSHAARAEAAMKAGAPWNDQTGNARQGLFGRVEVTGTQVVIYLGHTMHYGVYLELGTSRMAARPIVIPVMGQTYPEFVQDAVRVIRGLFG